MQNFLFCSRHEITPKQHELAQKLGIALHQGIDLNAFEENHTLIKQVCNQGAFEGVIVVHPALALKLSSCYKVGVFENAMRSAEGEKPFFEAVGLEVFDLIPRVCSWEHTYHYGCEKVN